MKERDDFDRKVNKMVSDVQFVEKWPAASAAKLKNIRQVVSEELLERDHMEVTARALGALEEPEASRLLKIVEDCSQTFSYSSCALTAMAMPVAIQWRSPLNHSYRLKRVSRTALDAMAHALSQFPGIRRVVFDARPFVIPDIVATSARNLREYLWHLNAGTQEAWGDPAPTIVYSRADPAWQMVCFLGLEIADPNVTPGMSGAGTASEIASGQCEFMGLVRTALSDPACLQFHCHGVWPLHEALRQAQKALRRHRLQEVMQSLRTSATQVCALRVIYSQPALSQQVHWVVSRAQLHLHGQWPLFQGEFLSDFVQELIRTVSELSGDNAILEFEFVKWGEFERVLTLHALRRPWMPSI
jgi:hypothetical protein